MNILALDLATQTGWALYEGFAVESGTALFDLRRGESPGLRYMRFNRWLADMVTGQDPIDRDTLRVRLIVYEQTISPGVVARAPQEIATGFATRVQEFCARRGIEHAAVYPSTLKKWTTGKGNANKVAMLEAVARRWKRVDTSDEADALALLYYALAELVPKREP